MNKIIVMSMALLCVTAALVLSSCASIGAIFGSGTTEKASYFTGDGGKGMSIAILAPKGTGIAENQNYLPTLVQGEFVSNFSGYSAISVLDRVSLDEQYAELLSGYYDDDAKAGQDLGHLTPTDYIMSGSITKTATGYGLQMRITKTTNKMTAASYSGTCTFAELDDLSGIRRASLDLLEKMGVTPTEQAKTELAGAATRQAVNAQTALSKGIAAQRSGDEFSAWTNFFEARTFDSTLTEATTRVTSASASNALATNTGTGLRDSYQSQIQQEREKIRYEKERKEAVAELLRKATAFYKAHQPFQIEIGDGFTTANLNYDKETVDVSVSMGIAPLEDEFKIIRQLTAQAKTVGYGNWPYRHTIGASVVALWFGAGIVMPVAGWVIFSVIIPKALREANAESFDSAIWNIRTTISGDYLELEKFTVVADIINGEGKKLKRVSFPLRLEDSVSSSSSRQTFTIKLDDLTDNLTLQIVSVNGRSIDSIRRNGYVKIDQAAKTLTSR